MLTDQSSGAPADKRKAMALSSLPNRQRRPRFLAVLGWLVVILATPAAPASEKFRAWRWPGRRFPACLTWGLSHSPTGLGANPGPRSSAFVFPDDRVLRERLRTPGADRDSVQAEPPDPRRRITLTDRTETTPDGHGLRIVEERPEIPLTGQTLERGYMDMNREYFGEAAARFLGHERRPDGTHVDPDADTLNAALDGLNAAAESDLEKPAVRFYEPHGVNRVSAEEYAGRFAFFGELPKARNSGERLHDGNFHEAAITLDPSLVRLKRAQIRVLLRQLEFLERNGLLEEYLFVAGTTREEIMDD